MLLEYFIVAAGLNDQVADQPFQLGAWIVSWPTHPAAVCHIPSRSFRYMLCQIEILSSASIKC